MNLPGFHIPLNPSTFLPVSSSKKTSGKKTSGVLPSGQAKKTATLLFRGQGDQADVLSLTGAGVRPELSDPEVSPSSHWARLKKLQAHAQASARLIPNYSGRHYGALVVLADGTEAMSANVEASRQVSLCDLQLAIGAAQNRWIEKHVSQLPESAQVPAVRAVYLVNANLEGDQPIPCADCQKWLASPLCPPDVKIISLEKTNNKNNDTIEPIMRIRTVQQMLPLYKRENPAFTTVLPLDALPVRYSLFAEKAIEQLGKFLSREQIQTLLERAQKSFHDNASLAKDSGLPAGASVLLMPSGIISEGGRVDWSTRWHDPADLATAAAALCVASQQDAKPQTIQAVAYYGNDPNLPPIASLGRMARKRGSANTFIINVEQDQIQLRTIQDFLPELYRAE